jgi:hypothetical protein
MATVRQAGTRVADNARTSQHAGVAGTRWGRRAGVPVAKHREGAREGRVTGNLGASRSSRSRDVGGGLSRRGYETEQASQRVKPVFKPQGFSTRPERPRAYSDMGRKRRVASETSSGVDGLGRAQTL